MLFSRRRISVLAAVAIIAAAVSSASLQQTAPAAAAVQPINDPRSLGGLSLFDAAGNLLTTGSDLTHIADFAQASSAQVGTKSASLAFALVDANQPDPQLWSTGRPTPATSYPTPALGSSLASPSNPTASLRPTDADLSSFLHKLKINSAVTIQVRLFAGNGAVVDPTRYWTSELAVDPNGGSWSSVPTTTPADATAPADTPAPADNTAPAAATAQTDATTTTDATSPETADTTPAAATAQAPDSTTQTDAPSLAKSAVAVVLDAVDIRQSSRGMVSLTSNLTAADGSHPAGRVELHCDTAVLGPASYSPATGAVNATVKIPAGVGSHQYLFTFTPADPTQYQSASSAQLQAGSDGDRITGIPSSLTVIATPPTDNAAYGATTIKAFLTPAGLHGTVQFSDFLAGTLGNVKLDDGTAKFITNSLGAGRHIISATFTPAEGSCATTQTAVSQPFTLTGATAANDSQTATATVDPGHLTITTPYTPDHPFSFGSLVLSSSGSKLFASAHFGSASDAAVKGITITDSRPGAQPWTASVGATNFVNGSAAINAQNLGFINVRQVVAAGGTTTPVITHDLPPAVEIKQPAAAGADGLAGLPKAFANVLRGGGSVYLYGDMVLSAPTTTPAGTYSATLTFTVG